MAHGWQAGASTCNSLPSSSKLSSLEVAQEGAGVLRETGELVVAISRANLVAPGRHLQDWRLPGTAFCLCTHTNTGKMNASDSDARCQPLCQLCNLLIRHPIKHAAALWGIPASANG